LQAVRLELLPHLCNARVLRPAHARLGLFQLCLRVFGRVALFLAGQALVGDALHLLVMGPLRPLDRDALRVLDILDDGFLELVGDIAIVVAHLAEQSPELGRQILELGAQQIVIRGADPVLLLRIVARVESLGRVDPGQRGPVHQVHHPAVGLGILAGLAHPVPRKLVGLGVPFLAQRVHQVFQLEINPR
jgi:hypothetical protein